MNDGPREDSGACFVGKLRLFYIIQLRINEVEEKTTEIPSLLRRHLKLNQYGIELNAMIINLNSMSKRWFLSTESRK